MGLGYWAMDHVGLPTYNYTGIIPYHQLSSESDEITYPVDPWFLLGNYGVTVFVHTSGVYDIYTLRRAWGRLNVASETAQTNQAIIEVDNTKYCLTGLDAPIACQAKKVFGTGFANFEMEVTDGLHCERTIATLPSEKINTGASAMLISIKIANTSTNTRSIKYTESVLANYEMVNEKRISYHTCSSIHKNHAKASFDPITDKTLIKPPKEEASTYDFYPPELFIKGRDSTIYKSVDNTDKTSIISAINSFELKPGGSIILQYVVGFNYDNERIEDNSHELFTKGKADEKFRSLWKSALPDYSFQCDEIIRREMYWNTYVLEASAKYNDYFEETFIPQGMTYDYIWGLNAVARDHLHYTLPTNYFNPKLSQSILRFVLKQMNPNGFFHYNVNGYGYAVPNLWNPSDLQLHLFWAVAEYLEKTNDYSFLKETTCFYPKRINYSASVIEKLRVAFDYLNDEIGTGPHGLVKMLNGDWNDQIWNEQPVTIYYPTAESHYNSSMAIVVLKQLIEQLEIASNVIDLSDEKDSIDVLVFRIKAYHKKILKAYIVDLGTRVFAKRAYFNETLDMGAENMHIESQLYTLMIEDIPLEQRQKIVIEVQKRLGNNEVLGVRTTEKKVSDTFAAGTHENGGIWQYIQGMYALGLLHVDIDEADRVVNKMSFNNFAKNYPNYWPGQWTGADVVNSSMAKLPGLVSDNGSEYMDFPTYCAHIHSWPLLYQFKKRERLEKQKNAKNSNLN